MEPLPNSWTDILPDVIYQTVNSLTVSFAKKQIRIGKRYDGNNKHIQAIHKGRVPPDGNVGLVPSEIEGFDLKSKVLGQGGDYRFHGQFQDGTLHFPGVKTSH